MDFSLLINMSTMTHKKVEKLHKILFILKNYSIGPTYVSGMNKRVVAWSLAQSWRSVSVSLCSKRLETTEMSISKGPAK